MFKISECTPDGLDNYCNRYHEFWESLWFTGNSASQVSREKHFIHQKLNHI